MLPSLHEILSNWLVGLVYAGLAILLASVWRKWLHPILRGLLAQEPNVAGEWESSHDGKEQGHRSTMKMKQIGAYVTANIDRTESDNSVRCFSYSGVINSGQVVLTFKEKGREGYNVGAVVLHLASNGQELRGKSMFFHHDTNQVVARDRVYRKKQAH